VYVAATGPSNLRQIVDEKGRNKFDADFKKKLPRPCRTTNCRGKQVNTL
jgi:hypothetical protein